MQRERFSYDRGDNRSGVQRDAEQRGYSYNPGNLLVRSGQTQYRNNAVGERTEKIENGELTRYHWNARGLLTRVELPGGEYVEYRYDAFGRRVYREHHDPGRLGVGRQTEGMRYLWDGSHRPPRGAVRNKQSAGTD